MIREEVISVDKVRKGKITKEYNKLKRLYAELPENKLKLVTPVIQNAAFMKVTLEDLQYEINEEGYTDDYRNGNEQSGRKASAKLQAYTSLMKQYTVVIDRLQKMLPEQKTKGKLEAFLDG